MLAEITRVASESSSGLQRNAAVDAARSRELYKYFRPPTASASDRPPDTVLTAHAQLVAWRLDAQRAIISLIDRETQYFVAESTKTLHLNDARVHDAPGDAIWAGCINVPKAGRLCEHTIATLPPLDGGPACFEVLDLAEDTRFNALDFIAGPPHFRYYVGVPLRTRKGISIGSLFALDDRARPGLTPTEKDFLAVMADNVVQHLETMKEKKDRQRSAHMNRCMSTFVDPGSATVGRGERDDHLETFSRAANLLRDAMDIEEGGGGVVFLDTSAATSRGRPFRKAISKNELSSGQESDQEALTASASPESEHSSKMFHASHNRPVDILAHAYHSVLVQGPEDGDRCHFTPMPLAAVSNLIRRHPRGKLFAFGGEGQLVSSSSDELSAFVSTSKGSKNHRTTASQAETEILRRAFPTARQVIFLPLWDTTTSRWSACFVYNCCDFRNFSYELDFLYCVAFSNCVTTETARLAALAADQQKSDFIGSISHELRSPLHGILASCEFLGDTDCTSFQRSLIDTANSCGRTLLDTINMVLDYSKINAFERNTTKARRTKRGAALQHPSVGLQSHLNLYSDVDLAAITEEVVEGVAIGHRRHGALDTDFSAKSTSFCSRRVDVYCIVDIAMRDWTFWSQPGAFRRIVMNLFGNSLKYTSQGFIQIKLEAEDFNTAEGSKASTVVTLTITDSGQGISSEYLGTKLFTPFAQESSLSPGTGLGLSLVKSIVTMLGGEIDIESTVGVGTKVSVRLPMSKGIPTQSRNETASTPSSGGSVIERVKDKSMDLVRAEASQRRVAIFWNDKDEAEHYQGEASLMMRKSLETYLQGWFSLSIEPFERSCEYDVIITQETDLNELVGVYPQISTPRCRTMALVLCETALAQSAMTAFPASHNLEDIRYPFGPYKLARALRNCLERCAQLRRIPSATVVNTFGTTVEHPSPQQPMDEVVNAVENLTIPSSDPSTCEINIVKNGNLTSREDSVNAQMATNNVGSLQVADARSEVQTDSDFPFPTNNDLRNDGTISPPGASDVSHTRPTLPPMRRTISPTQQEITLHDVAETNATSSRGALTNAPATAFQSPPRSPRMLLVDDNRINLKLLQTFMRKRKYTAVTNAEDGLQAVNAYTSLLQQTPPSPPDIILMDISMPIMDGFEATRRIREIERVHHEKLPPLETPANCLIIALTGLASARDQSEAFTSGFDLYVTKPVSFKEIARLLDNWESNEGGKEAMGSVVGVPHGAVVGGGMGGLSGLPV